MSNRIAVACLLAALATHGRVQAAPRTRAYAVLGQIAGPALQGWDYASVDPQAGRLYLAADTAVVLDFATGRIAASWPSGGPMVHTVLPIGHGAVAIDDGTAHAVRFADADTGRVTATVQTGAAPSGSDWQMLNPDAMLIEPKTGLLVAVNSASGTLVLIDTSRHAVTGTIAIGSRMEFLAADGSGTVFVNLAAENGIAAVDVMHRRVTRKLLFKGCDEPSGLAYDPAAEMLIAVCGNGVAKFVTAGNLKEVASLTVAKGADAVMIDAARHRVFIAGAEDGMMSVIRENGPHDIAVVQTIATAPGVRLGGVDPRTGKVYLPTVDKDMKAKRIVLNPHFPPVPPAIPSTFRFIIVGPA